MFAVHVRGTYLMTRAVIKDMITSGKGSIVNIVDQRVWKLTRRQCLHNFPVLEKVVAVGLGESQPPAQIPQRSVAPAYEFGPCRLQRRAVGHPNLALAVITKAPGFQHCGPANDSKCLAQVILALHGGKGRHGNIQAGDEFFFIDPILCGLERS